MGRQITELSISQGFQTKTISIGFLATALSQSHSLAPWSSTEDSDSFTMWGEDCYEGKSVLSPASASKFCLAFTDLVINWVKSVPEEIIPNILVRLPIKSLIKFTSVCQSWRSTIKDPSFIRTHLTHTLNFNDQNATHLLLLHTAFSERTFNEKGRLRIIGFKEDPYSLHYDNNACNQYCKVEFPICLKQTMENLCFRVAGSCNGLVLLADDLGNYAYNFVIWNPSIRKYVTLPKPFVRFSTHGRYDGSVGLGYDAIGNDYKVVRLTCLLDQPDEGATTLAQVYSLAKGTWGTLRALPPCIVPGCLFTVPFVNGALHWLAMRWKINGFNCFVVAFDVGNGSYREIMLPDFQQGRLPPGRVEMRLSVSGDGKSIALFVRVKTESHCFLDIWVMKEYCVEKSWTKLMIVTPQGPNRSLPDAVCFRRTGEVVLILEDSRELVSLDIVNKQFKILGISGGEVCSVDSYEESLVLLDKKDAVSY